MLAREASVVFNTKMMPQYSSQKKYHRIADSGIDMIDTDIDLCKWMNYNMYKNSNAIIKMIYIEGNKQICRKSQGF